MVTQYKQYKSIIAPHTVAAMFVSTYVVTSITVTRVKSRYVDTDLTAVVYVFLTLIYICKREV